MVYINLYLYIFFFNKIFLFSLKNTISKKKKSKIENTLTFFYNNKKFA